MGNRLFEQFILFPLALHVATDWPRTSSNADLRPIIWAQLSYMIWKDIMPITWKAIDEYFVCYDLSIFGSMLIIITSLMVILFYWIIIVISCQIIVYIKPDRYITAFIMSSLEHHRYNNVYSGLNGPAPPNVYELNFKYGNIYECNICMDPFCKLLHGNEDILHCGHRFHSSCLRQWEIQQLKNSPYTKYLCPTCKQKYHWRQKYQYIYAIQYRCT